ncbi:MAG: c-type cytochrome, partial [Dechloromonas sp.]|nr:c-type cytochrome [Dechloromonas sp.]
MIRKAALAILFATSFVTHASEEAHAKADPAKGKAIAESICVACHGADGNSPASANPNLAGQVEEYIAKQLKNFKPVGDKPPVRNNPIMAGMAAP